ncbi:MgtC/SapB family protein [Dactylosporangium sp. CA-139066]|uniref:MgtC/SapB family protein n=1 Tax=Dactylosporangium sp. CA-139066 TaxID=3239930 RepID=UPI003D933C4E
MVEDGPVIAGQVLTAVALGAVIGLEREFGAQPAGLRTHMLVSLGAAIFAAAGTVLPGSDPVRLAAQVATGIGFLGGGAILREGVTVRGLTTAASLWVTAAIGVAVGLRAWSIAIAATVLAVAVLWLVKQAELTFLAARRTLVMRLTLGPDEPLDAVADSVRGLLPRAEFLQVGYQGGHQEIALAARPPTSAALPQLAESLRRLPGVIGVDISG